MKGLLKDAHAYLQRGFSIIPIRHRNGAGKQPAIPSWSQFQQRRPTPQELDEWFQDDSLDGLAVICGQVSGGIVVRDFDQPGAYQTWLNAHPYLRDLPTVRTGRGHHVYFRAGLNRICKLRNGELRGAGYCLLPPSRHPNGSLYEWRVPLPDGAIPEVDLREFHTDGSPTEPTESDRSHPLPALFALSTPSSLSALSPLSEKEQTEFFATLPRRAGERNIRLFELARLVKSVACFAAAEPEAARSLVRYWHSLALPVIATKPFDDTWAEFVRAWHRVKFPKGCSPLDELMQRVDALDAPEWARQMHDSPAMLKLIVLCRELQRRSGDEPFYLSCRKGGQLVGIDYRACAALLHVLVSEGVLCIAQSHTSTRATRYRYLQSDLWPSGLVAHQG